MIFIEKKEKTEECTRERPKGIQNLKDITLEEGEKIQECQSLVNSLMDTPWKIFGTITQRPLQK